jgi:hypothetical protein
MAGTLCHPAPTTRRTEPTPPAREGYEAVMVAGCAVQVGEAVGEGATPDERLKLSTNEARHRSPLDFGGVEQARELVSHDAAKQRAAGRGARSTALDGTGGRWWGGTHLAVPGNDRADRISAACVALSGVGRHPVGQAFATHRGPWRAAAEQSGGRRAAGRCPLTTASAPLQPPPEIAQEPHPPSVHGPSRKFELRPGSPTILDGPHWSRSRQSLHCGPLVPGSFRLRARGVVTTPASTSNRYHRPGPYGGPLGSW